MQTESDRPAGRGDRPTSRVAGRQEVSDLQAEVTDLQAELQADRK
jgi:hypothetical protein